MQEGEELIQQRAFIQPVDAVDHRLAGPTAAPPASHRGEPLANTSAPPGFVPSLPASVPWPTSLCGMPYRSRGKRAKAQAFLYPNFRKNLRPELDLGSHSNRDRGRPHDLSPPTPPDRRVTSPAVRRVESMRRGQAAESERVEERCWKGETQRRALTETPGAVCRFGGVPGEGSAYAAAA